LDDAGVFPIVSGSRCDFEFFLASL
jgi:hypothetical protein